jgi:hypothetical protein
MRHRVRRGIVEGALSGAVFVGLLGAILAVDERVRQRVSAWFVAGGVDGAGERVSTLIEAMKDAVLGQSIADAPLVIFATVAAVLVFFMLKT